MHAIILPIKPQYVEKILSGDKKYEYRRKLCKKEIDTILIYETSPTKRIVAQVEVVEKITKKKIQLWKETKQSAGIEEKKYFQYFSNTDYASAYKLGKVEKFIPSKQLVEFGVDFYPQSYVYIEQRI